MTRAIDPLTRYVVAPAGCWEWTGPRDRRGYGRHGRSLAHRAIYELLVGPLPRGTHGPARRDLDHLCRNPGCVNPEHLELVTHAENVRRGLAGEVNGTRQRGLVRCKRGHEFTAENTGRDHRGDRFCRECNRALRRGYYASDPERFINYTRRSRKKKKENVRMITRQGDVLLVSISNIDTARLAPIPREAGDVVLAHGEATGHKHRFRARTTRMFAPWPEETMEPSARIAHARALLANLPDLKLAEDAVVVGVVELEKADALVHEEHSAIPHDAGQYLALRQREYTPEAIRVVAD